MKKRKGFTLIELLAVIVILAIVALIATPIILNIIEKARKSAFQDSAYGIIKSGEYYYAESLLTGGITEDKTIILEEGKISELGFSGTIPNGVITINTDGKVGLAIYDNKWCVTKGINDSKVTVVEYEENKCIIPDSAKNPVITLNGDREITLHQGDTYTELGAEAKTVDGSTLTYTTTITKDGNVVASIDTSAVGEYTITYTAANNNKIATEIRKVTILKAYICKRATTLHTETCTQTDTTLYCSGAGYTASGSKGTTTITYGNLGTGTTLTSGDAFDCDVNGDGTYDAATERFYYVSDLYNTTTKAFDNNYAVLVYYNNTTAGVADNTSASLVAYHSSNYNYQGPVTAIANLPTTSQWSNVSLSNTSRAILTETGTTSTSGGTLPTAFSYSGYAARLLTAQEINSACGITVGSKIKGELDKCNYLMENTKYSNSTLGTYGYWLETPYSSDSSLVWIVYYNRTVDRSHANSTTYSGVRPAIEILKSDISM